MKTNVLRKGFVLLIASTVGSLLLNSCRQPAPPEPKPQPVKIIERAAPVKTVALTTNYPSEVYVDQPYEYEIILNNEIPDCGVGNVTVEQQLSEGFEFMGSSPQGYLKKESNIVTWELGDMNPGESRTIRVRGKATRGGSVVNCSKVDFRKKICGEVVAVAPKLTAVKSMPAVVYECQKIPVKITVSNTGTGTLKDVKVEDNLPSGLSVEGGKEPVWTIPALDAGQTKEITYTAVATRPGVYKSTVTATGKHLKAESTANIRVVKPVLAIAKGTTDKVFIGQNFTSDITITNKGDAEAQKLVVKDIVPAGAKFVSATSNGQFSEDSVVWKLADLGAGKSVKISATFSAGDSGVFNDKAIAEAYCADPVSASASTKVVGIPAILLEVIDIKDPVSVGDSGTYIITATNQGSAPGTNIVISCTLEDSQSFISASGPTRESVTGDTITFGPLPSLAPKQKASWKVTVKALKADDVRFRVKMVTDQLRRSVDETEATNQY